MRATMRCHLSTPQGRPNRQATSLSVALSVYFFNSLDRSQYNFVLNLYSRFLIYIDLALVT